MKYLVCPLLFGLSYWISGTGYLSSERGWKELVRRKTLMAISAIICLQLFSSLLWWEIGLVALTFWGIHFFGWFENKYMSIIRGVLAWLPLLLVYLFAL